MRWVWRAETGAWKLEYGALVLLVAGVAVAVLAFGLPTQVSASIERALCELRGDPDCERLAGDEAAPSPGDADDTGGEQSEGEDGGDPEAGESPGGSEESGGPETLQDGGEDTGGEETGDSDGGEVEPANYDPELAQELADAEDDLDEAEEELASVEEEYNNLDEQLLQLLSELIGLEDAKACFTEGDIGGCIWTAINLIPWSKLLKVGSKIPKMWRLFDKWNDLRRRLRARRGDVNDARGRRDKALEACGRRNSFLPHTLVLMADGTTRPIAEVETGDRVLATDPATGRTGAQPVTDTITATGEKELVTLTTGTGGHTETVTATADHPFRTEDPGAWTPAADLAPGDTLRTPDSGTLTVTGVRAHTAHRTVHNLTVAGPHTYYVTTGANAGLVHNQNQEDSCSLNWSPKSKPTFGHTFETHGAGKKNTQKLTGRAKGKGTPQGQWLDNDAAAQFLKDVHDPSLKGSKTVELPKGLGQVINPDGSIVDATHVTIVMKPNGTFRTAYPIVK